MSNSPIYKIIFFNQGQIFEIYARQIYQSDLYGFIEVEELVFGERSQMLVDPGEEKLKSEFEGVNRSYIPVHSVVRIDEVSKEGVGKISEAKGGKVSPFPVPAFPKLIVGDSKYRHIGDVFMIDQRIFYFLGIDIDATGNDHE